MTLINISTLRFPIILLLLSVVTIFSCSKDDTLTVPESSGAVNELVFKEFWDVFDRHYPLFHRKNINWQDVYDTYNPQITASTTDAELLNTFKTIMNTMIKDGHSNVTYNNSQEAGFESQTNQNTSEMVMDNTPKKVSIVASSANNAYVSFGTLKEDTDIGYINAKNFEPTNDNEAELNKFKSAVDAALTELKSKKGIILDIRTNGGGQGPYAYYLAGRFFANSTPIELIRQRIKSTTGSTLSSLADWASEQFIGYPDNRVEGGYVAGVFVEDNTISSSGSFQYTNKVALLTSNETASAAEYFTGAMKTQSHVKSIGETTFGIFAGSDIFSLKNGGGKWGTRVSTHDIEIKYNGSFQSFEGIGITPDEHIISTSAQVSEGRDVHIEAAINYLN